MGASYRNAPVRPVRFGPADTVLERRADGALILRSPHALGPYERALTAPLARWAAQRGDQVYLAERTPAGPWRTVTYAQAHAQVLRLAAALLARGLSAARPLVILSGNDIEHALLALAAMHVGIPFAPISVPYSLVSKDFDKLRYIVDLLQPGLVFAADGVPFARAIAAAVPPSTELLVTRAAPPGRAATRFSDLAADPAAAAPDAAVARAHAAITGATIAKFLFTSGSTGMPKAVINTHGMMCANQRMIAAVLPFLEDEPPVLLDWPPWNHTFGGNHDFNMVLFNGGTLYIDEGKPLPGQIEATVANLKDVSPTFYLNVPKGYEALLPYLERDAALRENFFRNLRLMLYAGAGLSQHVWDELQRLAVATVGERIAMVTSLGSTETAPAALFANWHLDRPGNVGLPMPGVTLKLVPAGDKLEMRVRGPSITPGYWKHDELTRAAFDDEGFYCMGDALRFADPDDPGRGLLFDGRVAEDFKLATGTWVSVGPLRQLIIGLGAPYVQDVVIAGHDRDDVAMLVFPALDACRALCPDLPAGADAAGVLEAAPVRAVFQQLLDRVFAAGTGSASRVVRAIVMAEPPSLDIGEATDKGSINQRAVLKARAALVEELYAEIPGARTLVARRPGA
ncbi:MAG: feruloyl-CoA synthase [Burkholderiales bacterium]|nr:feruloyl-CoA synthase [Burkholderiales bacterium]